MNRYIVDADDRLLLLPPHDGEDAMIQLLCGGRTMIFFEPAQIERLSRVSGIVTDAGVCDGLCFVCADALLGVMHEVYVPQTAADFAVFSEKLEALRPFDGQTVYQKYTCDQTGSHHRHT